MKAVVIEKFGGPEVLQYKDIPVPAYGEKEVLIKVIKTSVNYADLKNRTGKKATGNFPIILGIDLVGTIAEVGSEVKGLKVGQRVIAFPRTGSYAEYAVADEQLVFPIPASIRDDIAAASPIVSILSYKLLKDVGRIEKGESVLIHSAAGGVGTTAIQMANILGASTIIGTVGSISKKDVALNAGADYVYTYEDFSSKVMELTKGRGVDLVLDSMSGKVSEDSMNCLADYGRLVHFGNSGGVDGSFKTSELHASCRSVLGFSLGTTRKKRPNLLREAAEHVICYLSNGELDIVIGGEYPLSRAAEAHQLIESRKHTGKILLHIQE